MGEIRDVKLPAGTATLFFLILLIATNFLKYMVVNSNETSFWELLSLKITRQDYYCRHESESLVVIVLELDCVELYWKKG